MEIEIYILYMPSKLSLSYGFHNKLLKLPLTWGNACSFIVENSPWASWSRYNKIAVLRSRGASLDRKKQQSKKSFNHPYGRRTLSHTNYKEGENVHTSSISRTFTRKHQQSCSLYSSYPHFYFDRVFRALMSRDTVKLVATQGSWSPTVSDLGYCSAPNFAQVKIKFSFLL